MIEIQVDQGQVEAMLARAERQIPFAASVALNKTAEVFQDQERLHLQRVFRIRRTWVLQGIKINREDRATKAKLAVTVRVDPSRGFLVKFEAGGEKRPQGRSIAVPERQVFPRERIVPKGKRPRAYQFQTHMTRGGKVQLLGSQRTFILQTAQGRGVFQRRGRRAGSSMRLLFWLAPSAQIKPLLAFMQTARRTMQAEWARQFEAAFQHAVQTAR